MYMVRVVITDLHDTKSYYYGPSDSFDAAVEYSHFVTADPSPDQVVEAYVETIHPMYALS